MAPGEPTERASMKTVVALEPMPYSAQVGGGYNYSSYLPSS